MSTREDFEPSAPERCVSCGEELERGECCTVGCDEYERAVHGPVRYEAQLPWCLYRQRFVEGK